MVQRASTTIDLVEANYKYLLLSSGVTCVYTSKMLNHVVQLIHCHHDDDCAPGHAYDLNAYHDSDS